MRAILKFSDLHLKPLQKRLQDLPTQPDVVLPYPETEIVPQEGHPPLPPAPGSSPAPCPCPAGLPSPGLTGSLMGPSWSHRAWPPFAAGFVPSTDMSFTAFSQLMTGELHIRREQMKIKVRKEKKKKPKTGANRFYVGIFKRKKEIKRRT